MKISKDVLENYNGCLLADEGDECTTYQNIYQIYDLVYEQRCLRNNNSGLKQLENKIYNKTNSVGDKLKIGIINPEWIIFDEKSE